MLGQLPGGRILLATRRDGGSRRLAVRSGAWSSVLPATGPGDGDRLVVQYFYLARLTRSGRITRRAERLRGPGTWSSSARRSCSVTPWCASSSTRAPRSRNNAGFIGRWRLRVTRASIRIGSRGILGMAARGPDDAVAARLEQAAERAHASAGPSARQPPFAPGRVSRSRAATSGRSRQAGPASRQLQADRKSHAVTMAISRAPHDSGVC